MNASDFQCIGYSQQLSTCVLASYAIACFPFTGTPVVDYFVAYCRHFNLDQAHPERSYERHFHPLSRTTPGYQVLWDLHNRSLKRPFLRARAKVDLSVPINWPNDTAAAESAIRQPDCLLLLFVNSLMHSIVVGHDGSNLYHLDTARPPGQLFQVGPGKITDFGQRGDAYLVALNPHPRNGIDKEKP
jgi:hypothetical protein